MDSGIVAQFTEDLVSTGPIICGRDKCKAAIAAGEPRHYLGGFNSPNGKWVCDKCITHYRAQSSTMSRTGKEYESISQSAAQDVRQNVNAARKRGASKSTRHVTAVSSHVSRPSGSSNGQMLPPPVPLQPYVSIPSSWQPGLSYPPPGPTPFQPFHPGQQVQQNPYGYSSAHAQYAATRQLWSTRAYQSSIADTITLRFKVLYETHGKPNGVQVQNLSEGEPNVLADATPVKLRELAIQKMAPKVLVALKSFPMPWERIILREISTWVDLGQQPPDLPYFYDRCITGKPKGKDGAKTFKKPTKAFELALVIDSDLWEEISLYLADPETSQSSVCSKRSLAPPGTSAREEPYSDDSDAGSPSETDYELNPAFGIVQMDPGTGVEQSFHREFNPDSKCHSPLQSQRLQSAEELSQSLPRTPPPSKRRAIVEYESPNRDDLREALLEGGSSFSQVSKLARSTFERIEFFHILERPLKDLLSSKEYQGFTCDPAEASQGSLGMEKGDYLGIGTFKTAHPAYLTLIHLASDGLGSQPNEAVALKIMYVRRSQPTSENPDAWVINRLMPVDEHRKIIMEANVLLWATSIMVFTYSFIWHFVKNSPHPPPFEIPEIRFVHAGVAILHEQGRQLNTSKSAISRSYLVEELIDQRDGFYKFINNASAIPLPLPSTAGKSGAAVAEFLAFTQHVQYYKTGGMVYLSDLQGSTALLTDPQIMTTPNIGNGLEIFGDGNVPEAFKAFPEQHVCNHFCRWFELPALDRVGTE
ncbi:hypothetical protein C8R47DRAFT_1235093 [Mycena vitilis]|nr:hypothetical protein C8R47DRAFT_1235093 [Mycena vitilis]